MIKFVFNKRNFAVSILVTGVLIAGVFFVVFRNNAIRDWSHIVESGRLKVVTIDNTEGFKTQGDSLYGFQYELIKAFATQYNLELEISGNNDLSENVSDLLNNEVDIVAQMVPLTADYSGKVLYTNALKVEKQLLVKRVDSTQTVVFRHYMLANDTVYLPHHSPLKMLITHLSDQIADTIYVTELRDSSAENLIKMVADGKIKYTLCPERLADKNRLLYKNIDITLPVGVSQEYCWVVKNESPELREKLNSFLKDFTGSEAYWAIYNKYYK